MPEFPPAALAAWTGGRWTESPAGTLTAFGCDTRKLRAGDVFVALRTEKRDGHDFLAEARAAGASAALVARANPAVKLPQLVVADPLTALQTIAREHRRGFAGRVIGISGSAGKTSTKDLLALLLGGASCGVVATEGNLNNTIGVPLTLTRIEPARHTFAVVEAGISEPGEMAVLAGMIAPEVALITLIAPAHTQELGGIGGVAREKARLPAAIRPGGVAIFSAETAAHPAFRALTGRRQVVARLDPGATLPADADVGFVVAQAADHTTITLRESDATEFTVTARRVSAGMAQNAALAIVAARGLGVSIELIQSRLGAWQPARLRGEIRHEEGRLLYLDCYNANPASMLDALDTFDAIAPAAMPRLYVIGCMEELGAEAAAHHRALGQALRLRPEDRAFVIGTQAHEVRAAAAVSAGQLEVVATLEPVAAAVAEWSGAVFVKGSRRYQLEKALDRPPAYSNPG
jgi:UDP-N-acetylmuramoyl-tripeptide--D-alanyl-D-alanine ligase